MVRGVPIKTDPLGMAERLLANGDRETALKRVRDELALARRARSRHRYGYWAAVESHLRAERREIPPRFGADTICP